MAFIVVHTSKLEEKELIDNKADSNKTLVITNMRVNNEAASDYEFSLYLRTADGVVIKLSFDDLDQGDYIVDDTEIVLPPGYALLDKTNIADTVKVIVNGYEK